MAKMVRKKNQLWLYYNIIGNNEATCKLCQKTIKTSGNTSNMIKHLRLRHPKYTGMADSISEFIKRETSKAIKKEVVSVEEELHETAAACSAPQLATDVPAAGMLIETTTSTNAVELLSGTTLDEVDIIEFEPMPENEENVYEIESMLMDENNTYLRAGDVSPDLAIENVSRALTTPQREQSTTTLQKHLLRFICKDKLPLETVDGEGFRCFFKAVCPLTQQLPTSQELRIELEKSQQQHIHKTRALLSQLYSVSLSCDIWQHKEYDFNYFDITAHFIDADNVTVRHRFLATHLLPPNFTAADLLGKLRSTCQTMNIQKDRVECVVSENAEQIVDAVRDFVGVDRHVSCLARTLESILCGIADLDSLRQLLGKIRNVIKYFLTNTSSMDFLNTEQHEQHLPALILDNPDNSFSMYYMLERYLQLAKVLHKFLYTQPTADAPVVPTTCELESVRAICHVLQPIEVIIREMSKDLYMPLSKVLPMIYTLGLQVKLVEHYENKLALQILRFTVNKLELHFGSLEYHSLTALSCLLDPRFKNVPFNDQINASKFITLLTEQQKHYIGDENAADDNAAGQSAGNNTFDFWTQFGTLARERNKRRLANTRTDAPKEIVSYFSSDVCPSKTAAPALWRDMRNLHPFLYQRSREFVHMPAVSIPTANIFTEQGIAIRIARQQIGREYVDNILFLSDSNESEWNV